MKRKLIAKRDMRYGTRRLKAGDQFDCSASHAKIFTKLGHCAYVDHGREPAVLPPIPAALKNRAMAGKPPTDPFDHDGDGRPGGSPKPEPSEDLAMLRAAYQEKMGKRPFPGWGADELRRRMADAAP